ncbi:MAG: hypothetical protein HY904_23410 [Deltaproteobacteria bacterium]|nr:hypothetical protein [Deltaproteobacteria bacterium]
MVDRRSLSCVVVLSAALLGCATSSGALPTPPTDRDLASNGTPAEKELLLRRYSVRVHDHMLTNFRSVSVGDARRPYALVGITHPELARYLQSDPQAGSALLPTWREAMVPALTLPSMLPLGAFALALLPAALVTTWSGRGLDQLAVDTTPAGWNRPTVYNVSSAVLLIALGGAIASAVLGCGLLLLGQLLSTVSDRGRTAAVNAFNANLAVRIEKNARP